MAPTYRLDKESMSRTSIEDEYRGLQLYSHTSSFSITRWATSINSSIHINADEEKLLLLFLLRRISSDADARLLAALESVEHVEGSDRGLDELTEHIKDAIGIPFTD
jgi:hypothetical protein